MTRQAAKKQSTCNRCGAFILWFKSRNGKNVPVNPDPRSIADFEAKAVYDSRIHVWHGKTCPKMEKRS